MDDVLHLAASLDEFLVAVRTVLDAPSAALAPADAARAVVIVKQLRALLTVGDTGANALACDEAATLRAALGPAADSLLRHVEDFDYESAIAILDRSGML